jgi:phage terminase Nu1 subunit (DNA packaging protein)
MSGVNATVVARVLNLSVSRVHGLQAEPGWPPKLGPGEFDLNKFTLHYVRYLQAELTRRGPSGGIETAAILAERLRLLKTQTEKGERDNAVERGEFLRTSAVREVWERQILNCRSRLLAMPTKLAVTLVNRSEPGLIAEILKREVYSALTDLSGGTQQEPSDDATGDAESGPDAL